MKISSEIICGNTVEVLKSMKPESVDMVITSPPYWSLRDYGEDTKTIWRGNKNCEHKWEVEKTKRPNASGGHISTKLKIKGKESFQEFVDYHKRETESDFCSKCGAWRGQLGLEPTFELYIEHMLEITKELKRVLKKTGIFWLNISDTYAGSSSRASFGGRAGFGTPREGVYKHQGIQAKCLCMIPERLALGMIEQKWTLRNKIVWHKPNAMPSSVHDRFNTCWEFLYLFSKSRKYYFDLDAVREPHSIATLQRIQYYQGKFKVFGEKSEQFGSQRARNERPYAVQERTKEFVEIRDLPEMREFSKWLNKWRKEKGITIDIIERAMNSQSPHHWFNGEAYPSVKDWGEFKKLYNPPTNYDEQLLNVSLKSSAKQNHPLGKNPGDIWQVPLSPKYQKGKGHSNRQGLNRPLDTVTIKAYKEYQQPIAKYLKKHIQLRHYSILDKIFGAHKWRHWIRTDYSGAALPGVDDWSKLKEILNLDNTFDDKIYEVQKLNIPIFQSGRNPGDVWDIPTKSFSEAHFAVFPEGLCIKPIQSGCPAQICKKCGKIRKRIIKRRVKNQQDGEVDQKRVKGGVLKEGGKPTTSRPLTKIFTQSLSTTRETISWTNCNCNNPEYEPGIVLDPFCGAGTVGVVCAKLGRNFIGIDIKEEYCEMARKRIKPYIIQERLF